VHYPLGAHKFAMPAARAAECAREQGRFAEYITQVYAKQDSLGLKPWLDFAKETAIPDIIDFSECVAEKAEVPNIAGGIALGKTIGVRGTPTIIINGWRYPMPPTDELSRSSVPSSQQVHHPNPTRIDEKAFASNAN